MWAFFNFFEGWVSISPCVLWAVFDFFSQDSISPRSVQAALMPLSRAVTVVMSYAAVNAASSPPYLSVGMCESVWRLRRLKALTDWEISSRCGVAGSTWIGCHSCVHGGIPAASPWGGYAGWVPVRHPASDAVTHRTGSVQWTWIKTAKEYYDAIAMNEYRTIHAHSVHLDLPKPKKSCATSATLQVFWQFEKIWFQKKNLRSGKKNWWSENYWKLLKIWCPHFLMIW